MEATQHNRFIPTYVGHTIQGGDLMVVKRVHPHLRGAYLNGTTGATISCGSSPPTWGIRLAVNEAERQLRFIPTYVGHTLDRRKKNGWFQPLLL